VRIALIADIHGNLPALDAVLADFKPSGADRVICLGDVGAMGPFPVETLERVRDLRCPVIMGNGDAAMLDPPELPDDDETARKFAEMDHWCAARLSDDHRATIRSYRERIRIQLPNGDTMLVFHGSPRSVDEIISATTSEHQLDEMLDGHSATIMAGGHWHFQMLRRHKDAILFNPGSVGLVYEFDSSGNVFIPPRAEYGIIALRDTGLSSEHRRVEYDSSQTTRAMHDRGFPHADWWTEKWA
jgi:putative phosphoesterase